MLIIPYINALSEQAAACVILTDAVVVYEVCFMLDGTVQTTALYC